ncbi:MAG: FAD-dependent oxidoreductase [Chloroflexota bacterium]|nr:FAD-dependent oxidoreductase [Chloroflexota bacterium]
MKVIVVGAGLAGLTAAADLADAGAKVLVLEKRDVPGGKVSSWYEGEYPVESGLHIFFGCYRELLAMMKRVGAYDNINWKEHTILVARPGGKVARFRFPNVPAPFNGIVAFTGNDLLTWHEKLTNVRALIKPWLSSLRRVARWDDRTYAQWHRDSGIAEGVLTKWWNPIALSMGFLEAEEMSARPMTTVFHHFSRHADASRVGFLDGPPGERMHRPFIDYIEARGGELRCGSKVEQVELDWSSGKPGVSGVSLANGEILEADAVVLAAPLHNARRMVPKVLRHHPYFANLWRLKSVPVMNVQVWFDRYVSEVDNLFFTADAPFSVFADLAVTSPLFDRTGGSLISMAVAPAHNLWHLADGEIVGECVRALNKLWPRTRPANIVHSTVVRIPNSIYREVPGSDALRPTQRTPLRNLALAGDYTRQDYMASIEGAVRSGHRAERALVSQLGVADGAPHVRIVEPRTVTL